MGARGSAIHSCESITNEYTWRPTERGTVTDQTPPALTRVIGVVSTFQPLKSPTSDTFPACGATNWNVVTVTVSDTGTRVIGAGTADGCSIVKRSPRFFAKEPPSTPMPTKPAARAMLAMGDAAKTRG